MEKTLTIRIDAAQQKKLGQTAKLLGKSVSELVREILHRALDERTVNARVGHLKGSIALPATPRDSWSSEIKERNWRG